MACWVCLGDDPNALNPPVAKAANPPAEGAVDAIEPNAEGDDEAKAANPPELCAVGIIGFPNPVWPKLGWPNADFASTLV